MAAYSKIFDEGAEAGLEGRLRGSQRRPQGNLQSTMAQLRLSIHNDSVPGSMSRSALTSISDANRTDDLTSMAKLQIATNRNAAGVLVSDAERQGY
ncbi:uncharacterized protein BJ212DRAFT_1479440 [Suillus subaureus]|uniref:Uncharacterized protein n=1 Tax=Suillus subaureus TaxID=48587 RepID=A0A9P7EDL6_9AGAM|nr:uncharacterized protein BJ212DRAFT_1479440 [Suillus subaureus]KAG1818422.1 hypothetical protein BJ212DRAFT_1479440 [Suillus subaureus]